MLVTALTLSTAAGLSACGGDDGNPYGLSNFSGSAAPSSPPVVPSASSSAVDVPTPPPAPSGAVTYTPADAFGQGAWVERGRIVAAGTPEKAVADAVVAYFRARVQISNTWQVDDATLASVATGKALTGARQRAQTQTAAGRRSIGRFVLNLATVTVKGDRAVVDGCPFDGTSEVDDSGAVIDYPPGGVRYRLDLVRQGGRWLVSTYPTRSVLCDAP